MLSRRIPHASVLNPWARALAERRAAGASLLDLTAASPTQVGLAAITEREREAFVAGLAAHDPPHPRGSARARSAVSEYYATRGIEVSPDALVLASGTSEAYAHLFALLCDVGGRVAIPVPSYPLFAPIAQAMGVEVEPFRLDPAEHHAPDWDSLEAALARGARAVVIVQPNHPTGSCLERVAIERLDALCARYHAALISDEVFGDHPWPGEPAIPSLLGPRIVPTFVLGGLSKLCGMPQLKLAWIALAGPADHAEEAGGGLEWLADLFLSVALPVQHALPELLDARHAFQARVQARLATNLAALRALCARRPELSMLPARGGWVAVLRLPSRHSDEWWALALLENGVVVHPGHFYDFEQDDRLVLSLIAAPEDVASGLASLEALIANG